MPRPNLYQRLSERVGIFLEMGQELIPNAVVENLNPRLPLRPYQKEALQHLIYYLDHYQQRVRPTQLLFHMATGSGKTLIMSAAILYLYQQGYRNFIFLVNSTNIIEKTRENFLNPLSFKHLFTERLKFGAQEVHIREVDNFQAAFDEDIRILFTTIQGLHTRLNEPRENSLTHEDFEDKDIVLISDEAHHINALTKTTSRLTKVEATELNTWEATVNQIFTSRPGNILLEFTATIELDHSAVRQKYEDKILYQYSLKEYHQDGYSKEVKVLQADLPPLERALQAAVISQYRRKVAEKHGIPLKPVLLMKSRIIAESEAHEKEFRIRMDTLQAAHLETLKTSAQSEILQEAFAYFETQGITLENLAAELREEFDAERCLVVNSKSDSEEKQLLVNSLEDPDNQIRVVFAVNKLNEGWDVLNLFDIVRLYNTRDAKRGVPGKTTISEAQLIGRGARYFPFQLDDAQPRFQRKFDDDVENDLRALEVLYYHSAHNPRYIQELHTALVDIGMMPERPVRQLRLNVKDGFRQSTFWHQGLLFTNTRVHNDNTDVFGVQNTLDAPRFAHRLRTGYAQDTALLDDPVASQAEETHTRTLALRDLGVTLLRVALARLSFYEFRRLRDYFPHLASITEFITSDAYLGRVEVDVTGTPTQLQALTPQIKMNIALDVLRSMADDVQRGTLTFTN